MKVGVVGVGHIGKTLVQKLSLTGHAVKAANSRGPDTIARDVFASGGHAVTAVDAIEDVDVVILSIPLARLPDLAPLVGALRDDVVVIDTSNYYPQRDGKIAAIEEGCVESQWVADRLGRTVVKAWNSIGSDSFASKGTGAGSPGRIALPVAGDRETDRRVAMSLVESTGFDAFDAGPLAESWRQQPGAPCYCTDLDRDALSAALARAEIARLPKRRDIAVAAIHERVGDTKTNPDADYGVRLCRALFL